MRHSVRMLGPLSATVLDYEPRAQLPRHHHAGATLSYIKRAKTPMLIQHGDADNTAPIAAAYELKAIMDQNLDWFEHWLLGKP